MLLFNNDAPASTAADAIVVPGLNSSCNDDGGNEEDVDEDVDEDDGDRGDRHKDVDWDDDDHHTIIHTHHPNNNTATREKGHDLRMMLFYNMHHTTIIP